MATKYFPKYEYTSNWKELSDAVKERDNYTCIRCSEKGFKAGGKEYLNAAHIISKFYGGKDEMSNLETVCLFCHVEEHGEHMLNSPFYKREFKKSAARRGRKDLLKKYNLL